ncbi:MAG TPA: alpha/beta hydrolase-fold protein [Gammaproteobacteria bacterium]|nr:alpha/beta hydrolase-fold protein [Gammaproteobacteria bacterium]
MTDTGNAVFIEPGEHHRSSVIWLHGLGANGHDFEPIIPELGLPANHGIRFIFPHAPVRPVTINGGMSMPAWYDVRHIDLRQQEDATSIRASAGIIEDFIDSERSRGIPAEKILLAGFSQGGAVALYCGLRHPQKLAGILALSAYLPLPDTLADEANPANRETPVMMCHGIYDPVIPVVTGQQSCELLQQNGYKVSWHSYPMQHAVCLEEIQAIADWLKDRLL